MAGLSRLRERFVLATASNVRAWLLVDTMNRCFKTPVVDAEAGGRRGGGTALTPLGVEVVRRYRRSEALAKKAAAVELAALIRLLRR